VRPAAAFDATVAWSPVSGTAGYKVYVRQGTSSYGAATDVGAKLPDPDGIVRYVTTGLPVNQVNYFVVTSYDGAGTESSYSNELSLLVTPTSTPTLTPSSTATSPPPTSTPTQAATRTATSVPTATQTSTSAATQTPTPTATPSRVATATATSSATSTHTPTVTRTATTTPTPTPTWTSAPAPADLTALGTIIARVRKPTGTGNKNLEVIRDGDTPPVGTNDPLRQYDTDDGANLATNDWIGYKYSLHPAFTGVVFQEGMHFSDGGWFNTLTVQVHTSKGWVPVSGLQISPAYPGNNGVGFETFVLKFDQVVGDQIRLYGVPGGTHAFISVGELRVYGFR
jgi:hypothetical protein